MDFIRDYQLDIMLVLTGILLLLLFFSITIKNLLTKNRPTFILFLASCTILLLADRYAYIFRGDVSTLGYWMVRICNFLTYLMTIGVLFFYNWLLKNMISLESEKRKTPFPLVLVDINCAVQAALLIISQFTGLLYTFDATNHYQRSTFGIVGYLLPMVSLCLQLMASIRLRHRFGTMLQVGLFLFDTVPLAASIIQFFVYGISMINIAISTMAIFLYVLALNDLNARAERSDSIERDHLRAQQQRMERLLDQTTTTLVTALDAKEEYTHGHSARVAKYARQIAEYVGKSEKECDEIYYAGLLHDIGKIGIPDEIINKKGKLTPEEYEIMKQHPSLGRQILSGITEMPYLAIGANFHHERYDGTGYPEGLAGKKIPELGRILAVADAYDAMSSQRSYRDAIPQQKIREEFIKYSGTQFDPEFSKIMQHLIDLDSEYQMKEKNDVVALSEESVIICKDYRETVSEGILISENPTIIRMNCDENEALPSFVLFDSLDARLYTDEPMRTDMNYFEYGELRFDGETSVTGARKAKTELHKKTTPSQEIAEMTPAPDADTDSSLHLADYEVTAVRFKDHALFTIRRPVIDYDKPYDESESIQVTIALPDKTRFLYVGITGENCHIRNIHMDRSDRKIGANFIPRIAEEISYIKGPEGDFPNIQIDGYRTETTEGIPIRDKMRLRFHTMSLPTARLVWHTAFIVIFTSDNKKVDGPNYKEFALIRLDGEYWDDSNGLSENIMEVTKKEPFTGWENWKAVNKEGMDCVVRFLRRDNQITTSTENNGISIRNKTTVNTEVPELYVALSGDQVALTMIQIEY